MTTTLCPGDRLLLFTDGLIERRDQPIDEALVSLLRAASKPIGRLSDYADHLLNNTGPIPATLPAGLPSKCDEIRTRITNRTDCVALTTDSMPTGLVFQRDGIPR